MIKVPLHPLDRGAAEPAPTFASDAEIKLAEQLRHQLEQRYLGAAVPPSAPRLSSDKSR